MVNLVGLAFLIPFDVLVLALSNTLFLIYPVRAVPGVSTDFQFLGRFMLFALLQVLLLIPCLGIPAAIGGLAYVLLGYSLPVFVATSWIVLAAELPLLLLGSRGGSTNSTPACTFRREGRRRHREHEYCRSVTPQGSCRGAGRCVP